MLKLDFFCKDLIFLFLSFFGKTGFSSELLAHDIEVDSFILQKVGEF